jgi:hypothetical protein
VRRRHAWEGFAFEREVKETSDDEGSEAGLKLEVVSLEKRDFDDTGGDRVRCREFIAESFGCWSGSQLIGVGIAMTSATKKGPKTSWRTHRNLHAGLKSMCVPTCFCSKSAHSERKTRVETVLRAVEINAL